jgi:hypothetical protein
MRNFSQVRPQVQIDFLECSPAHGTYAANFAPGTFGNSAGVSVIPA